MATVLPILWNCLILFTLSEGSTPAYILSMLTWWKRSIIVEYIQGGRKWGPLGEPVQGNGRKIPRKVCPKPIGFFCLNCFLTFFLLGSFYLEGRFIQGKWDTFFWRSKETVFFHPGIQLSNRAFGDLSTRTYELREKFSGSSFWKQRFKFTHLCCDDFSSGHVITSDEYHWHSHLTKNVDSLRRFILYSIRERNQTC